MITKAAKIRHVLVQFCFNLRVRLLELGTVGQEGTRVGEAAGDSPGGAAAAL